MYIYTYLLKMTDTLTSQNIDLSPWGTLYTCIVYGIKERIRRQVDNIHQHRHFLRKRSYISLKANDMLHSN
jgi:hypothetical protein